jgi:hypothetical protein
MLVLFDQGTPVGLRSFLTAHTIHTTAQRGWDRLENGDLLKAAEDAGFEVFVTPDKNIRHQQNLKLRAIAIVVVGNPQWPVLEKHAHRVAVAVNAATPGTYCEVEIPE